MKVELLPVDGTVEWNDYVEKHSESLLGHRGEWSRILSRTLGQEPIYLVAREDGILQGILPLALVEGLVGGRALVSLPWLDAAGVLADSTEVAAALIDRARETARDRNCTYLEIRALRKYDSPRPVRSSKVLLHLDLDSPDAMWKAFSAKVRNQIRKAEKEGLTASVVGENGLSDFYRVFSRNMRDIGVPVWGMNFFQEIMATFGERARLVIVRDRKEPVGAGLLLTHDGTAIVPSASSLRSHFKQCPNHLLYWTAIQEAAERGATVFDFGRSTPNSGTWRFKKQWGSREVPCYWHYDLLRINEPPERNTQSKKLRFAVETWKRLPLQVANRLGPLLVRRIP